jgi:hypothetical protein
VGIEVPVLTWALKDLSTGANVAQITGLLIAAVGIYGTVVTNPTTPATARTRRIMAGIVTVLVVAAAGATYDLTRPDSAAEAAAGEDNGTVDAAGIFWEGELRIEASDSVNFDVNPPVVIANGWLDPEAEGDLSFIGLDKDSQQYGLDALSKGWEGGTRAINPTECINAPANPNSSAGIHPQVDKWNCVATDQSRGLSFKILELQRDHVTIYARVSLLGP